MHRCALARRDTMIREGVPVTAPPRTLLDLAARAGRSELAAAVNEAHVQRLISPATLSHLISTNRGRAGIRALRALAEDHPQMTRSAAERRFLALLRRSGVPLPEANARAAGYEVDFLWREQRLIVETDGWAAHSSRTAFEHDRRRDAELAARGYRVVRITWRQLRGDPTGVVARALAATPRRTAGSG